MYRHQLTNNSGERKMANRGTLAISKLDDFKEWLTGNGVKLQNPKGCYEVLRWKSDVKGEAMPILFQKDAATVHLTCNDSAATYLSAYFRHRKQGKQSITVESE
jgi:hypothetical protein